MGYGNDTTYNFNEKVMILCLEIQIIITQVITAVVGLAV